MDRLYFGHAVGAELRCRQYILWPCGESRSAMENSFNYIMAMRWEQICMWCELSSEGGQLLFLINCRGS